MTFDDAKKRAERLSKIWNTDYVTYYMDGTWHCAMAKWWRPPVYPRTEYMLIPRPIQGSPAMAEPTTTQTRFGWSFLSRYRRCPLSWWNSNLRPHDDGTPAGKRGVVPAFTGEALGVGSMFHRGIQDYLLSGWEDGKYDVNAGIEGVHKEYAERLEEWEPEKKDKMLKTTIDLMDGYDAWWGPNGRYPDWPELQILADAEGNPLIEAEFEIDLDWHGYVFTARLDAVVLWGGYVCALEHKTTDVSWASRLRDRFMLDGQVTGQVMCLQSWESPSEEIRAMPIGGVLLNAVCKRAKNVDPFWREQFSRSPGQLQKFRRDTIRTLTMIEADIAEYEDLVAAGLEPWVAGPQVFASNPPGDTCVGNFRCDYFDLCSAGEAAQSISQALYRPNPRANQESEGGETA